MKTTIITVFSLLLLCSCNNSISKPTYTPSINKTLVKANTNEIATNTKENGEKEIPLIYLISHSGDGPSGDDVCLIWNDQYSLAIYEDGRVIKYYNDIGLFKSNLESKEIVFLLKLIQNTGYYDVAEQGNSIENDPTYINPPIKNFNGGPSIEMKVKDKKVMIYFQLIEYLIDPVKQTYNILKDFQLIDKVPFTPKTISLFGSKKEESNFTFEKTVQPLIWPSTLHPLTDWGYFYNYRGNELAEILSLFGEYYPTIKPIIYNNQEYYVTVCPRLE
jgi:hypothetical protein